MDLKFKNQINGKPTYFIHKIIRGLLLHNLITFEDLEPYHKYLEYTAFTLDTDDIKIHTLRTDKDDRWSVGKVIEFIEEITVKQVVRFSPKTPVISIQTVEFKNVFSDHRAVFIDGLRLTRREIDKLAKNDGFSTTDEFWSYFNKTNVTKKLIHWTNFKY